MAVGAQKLAEALVEIDGDLRPLKRTLQKSESVIKAEASKVGLGSRQIDKAFDTTAKKVEMSNRKMRDSMQGTTTAVRGLQTAFLALGVGALAKGFLETAKTLEKSALQLDIITGSAAEGAAVFKDLREFARTVPNDFEEIIKGSVRLLPALKGNREELKQFLPLIADISSVTQLSFAEVADQLARTFTAGIGAADRFREQGVTDMLGLSAQAKLTGDEIKTFLVQGMEDGRFGFTGGAQKLASTWTGIVSQLNDAYFDFQARVTDAGPFDFAKALAEDLKVSFQDSTSDMGQAAELFGKGVTVVMSGAAISVAAIFDTARLAATGIGLLSGSLVKLGTTTKPAFQGVADFILDRLGVQGFTDFENKLFRAVGKTFTSAALNDVFDPLESKVDAFNAELAKSLTSESLATSATAKVIEAMHKAFNGASKSAKDLSGSTGKIKSDISDIAVSPAKIFPALQEVEFPGAEKQKQRSLAEIFGESDAISESTREWVKRFHTIAEANRELDNSIIAMRLHSAELEIHNFQVKTGVILSQSERDEMAKKIVAIDSLRDKQERSNAFAAEFNRILEANADPADSYRQRVNEIKLALDDQIISQDMANVLLDDAMKKWQEANRIITPIIDEQRQQLTTMQEFGQRSINAIGDAFTDLATSGENAADAMRKVSQSIINDLIRVIVQKNITDQILNSIGIGPLQSSIQFTTPQLRAEGGPVSSGRPFIVGERGPELFIPNQSGEILSNESMGGGGIVVQMHNNFAVGVRGEVRAELTNALPQIKNAAVQAVSEAVQRGGSIGRSIRGAA